MRKLDLSSVSSTAGLPIKSGVMGHVQTSYQEALSACFESIIGAQYDPTKLYVLKGVLGSIVGSLYTINAGYIYYGGEIFLVDATSFTVSGNVGIATLVTTYNTGAAADPVQFTDGVSRNVLQIRKIAFVAGTSGTGLTGTTASDYANLIPVNSPAATRILTASFPSTLTVSFTQDQEQFFTTGIPNSGTATLAWNFNGAILGTVVSLKFTTGTSITFNISTGSGYQIVGLSGSVLSSKTNYMELRYVGKNESGNDEVRYTVVNI
jgi:hypothetical protein